MERSPDITVVIPVYNAAAHVREAAASALAQPEVAEVALVEDGSTDDSLEVCEAIQCEASNRVRLLRHPGGTNRGAGATRNLGVRETTSPLVAFLDADDFYLPNRFATARPLLDDPAIDGVHEAVGTAFDSSEARQWWTIDRGRDEVTRVIGDVTPDELLDVWLLGGRGGFHGNGLLIRRTLFDRAGGFEPSLRMCQDTHLWIRLSAAGRLVSGRTDAPVAMRRLHGRNRIMTDAALHRQYHLRMAQSLVRWSRRRLAPPRRGRLVDSFVQYWLEQNPPRSLGCKGRCLALATGLALRDPRVVRHSPRLRQLLLGRLAS